MKSLRRVYSHGRGLTYERAFIKNRVKDFLDPSQGCLRRVYGHGRGLTDEKTFIKDRLQDFLDPSHGSYYLENRAELMQTLARRGEVFLIEKVMYMMECRKVQRYADDFLCVIEAWKTQGRMNMIVPKYREMLAVGITPGAAFFARALYLLGTPQSGEHVQLMAAEAERLQVHQDPRVQSALLFAYRKTKDVEGAKQAFRQLEKADCLRSIDYGNMMLLCAENDDLDRLHPLLDECLGRNLSIGVSSLNAMLISCEKRNCVDEFNGVLKSFESLHVKPNLKSFQTIMRFRFSVKDYHGVITAFDSMRKLGIEGDAQLAQAVILSHTKLGNALAGIKAAISSTSILRSAGGIPAEVTEALLKQGDVQNKFSDDQLALVTSLIAMLPQS